MSRPRSIDRNAVLDAAETVVVRDGAARLTLDAVAAEAGISKPSVIYDYKTKQALIREVIDRRAKHEMARVQAQIDKRQGMPDACICGHIAAAAEVVSCDLQAVGVNLCAAAAQDDELRAVMEEMTSNSIREVLKTSTEPRRAMLALLALHGLRFLEFLQLHSWAPEERQRLLREIEDLATSATAEMRTVGKPCSA